MSTALNKVAGKIEHIHHKYEEIAAGLTAAAATSIVIGVVTFGVGAAAEDAAAVTTAVAGVNALLGSLATDLVTSVGFGIADFLAIDIVHGVIVGFGSDLAFQEVPGLYAGDGWSHVDVGELTISGVAGGFGGALMKGVLWRRMLWGTAITGSAAYATDRIDGKKLDAGSVLLSGVLGGFSGALAKANPGEKSASAKEVAKLEHDIEIATMYKSFYDLDPKAAARVAAKIDNPAVKDAYHLLTKYPGLFDTQVTSAVQQIGASRTVIGKVVQISTREKLHITYDGLARAVTSAKDASHEFTEKTTQKQAEEILQILKKMNRVEAAR